MAAHDPFPHGTGYDSALAIDDAGQVSSTDMSQDEGESQIGSTLRGAASQTQQKAGELVDQARQQTKSQLTTQKEKAAEGLSGVAQAVRQTGENLREEQPGLAGIADGAAEQVERFSGYLRRTDIGQMVSEVERVARSQPALFLGGAFALGVLGARFLKASSQQAQSEQQQAYVDPYMASSDRAAGVTPEEVGV